MTETLSGRELDAEVARALGCNVRVWTPDGSTRTHYLCACAGHNHFPQHMSRSDIYYWHSDLDACAELRRSLAERGLQRAFVVELHHALCIQSADAMHFNPDLKEQFYLIDAPAEAQARAALAVLKGEKDG
jgi:hypothetical protein